MDEKVLGRRAGDVSTVLSLIEVQDLNHGASRSERPFPRHYSCVLPG